VVTTDVVSAFAAQSRANSCTVHGPVAMGDAAGVVGQIAADDRGGGPIALAHRDPALRSLALGDALQGAARRVCCPGDTDWDEQLRVASVGITGAYLAVAEQGVLALACSPDVPRATSLLPPTHVCVLYTDTVLATFADAVERVASTLSPLPSALTWIGGPSRTGDLEMVQTLGVHGPKRVEIVLVDPAL
jgi:L-lactate dehydrogenase complex protein LldG